MNNKPTVTIGIPAYNEEANISHLLKTVCSQNGNHISIKKIMVISDKSTDNTDYLIEKQPDSRVKLIRNDVRLGNALTQNRILKETNTDYLIILDADILLVGKNAIFKIIQTFSDNKNIGLVAGTIIPLKPQNLLEKVLLFSVGMKEELYMRIKNGNNLYNCNGRFRAFSKEFYKILRWEAVVGEDAFSYFSCLSNGFQFRYADQAKAYYKLPHTLKDHLKQSVRFHNTYKELEDYFNGLVSQEVKIPVNIFLKTASRHFVKNPFLFILYLSLFIYTKFIATLNKDNNHVWDISHSSKKLFNYGKS